MLYTELAGALVKTSSSLLTTLVGKIFMELALKATEVPAPENIQPFSLERSYLARSSALLMIYVIGY